MITLVNVFTVSPQNQTQALQNIQQVYQEVVSSRSGFISANLLKSSDGKRVTAIAYWESEADLQAMRSTQKFKNMISSSEFEAAIISNEGHVYNETIAIDK
ncbi:antibiotic biosynthesis monooxygenase [Myxosarcina sp. GI1]|uniref:antibiotic biosynthesis monooxygenase family protein n=1 Tax=Myxosarcina sp. GI1 TaxID=1541065 RepID=UPI000565A420|nr:antibiotic biosynthesis monooxygenase [Myxosarcina sp. GI1]